MQSIAVLISTYNGQDFILDQINSVLNQKFDTSSYHLDIFVRDDGSTDSTPNILKQLMKNHSCIHAEFPNVNLGFAKSFIELLKSVEADYYFFADQDDVWLPNKVESFLRTMLAAERHSVISGVFSDSWIADQFARSTGKRVLGYRRNLIKDNILTFEQQIFETYVAGSSLFINRAARDKVDAFNYNSLPSGEAHDYFIGLVVSCFGELHYLDQPTMLYRQTGNNLYGARDGNGSSIFTRLRALSSRIDDVKTDMRTASIVAGEDKEKKVLVDEL